MNYKELIYEGIETALIDFNHKSNTNYRMQFIGNDYKKGKKMLSNIEAELLDCETFDISVAFITNAGITPLMQTLKILEKRNNNRLFIFYRAKSAKKIIPIQKY